MRVGRRPGRCHAGPSLHCRRRSGLGGNRSALQPANYNICYRFAGSGDDAQDLTQEVFIKMFRTLSSYDGERGAFMTWVTTITRNLLVDHFRKSKQDRMTDSLDAAPSDTKTRCHSATRSRTRRRQPMPACRAARPAN